MYSQSVNQLNPQSPNTANSQPNPKPPASQSRAHEFQATAAQPPVSSIQPSNQAACYQLPMASWIRFGSQVLRKHLTILMAKAGQNAANPAQPAKQASPVSSSQAKGLAANEPSSTHQPARLLPLGPPASPQPPATSPSQATKQRVANCQ